MNGNARRIWLFAALLALPALGAGIAALAGVGPWAATFHGTAYEPAEPAPDFRLTDHTGRQVSLGDFRGRAVLLFFGYTHCPDVCPLTLAKLRRALDAADAGPEEAHVLMVTVDPRRDTPAALADYVRRYGPAVSGLTGPPDSLARLAAAYGVAARPSSAEGHADAMHTSAVFGIDAQGRLRVLLRPENPADQLAADVRTLLR